MTLAVSNRGPLSFRFGPEESLEPVPAGGGLASSLRSLLGGTGATWVSVTMGAADRAAAAAGLMVADGMRLVPVPIDDDDLPAGLRRRGQHHAVVLPPPSL